MKKIIIGTIIVAAMGGGYLLANSSYIKKVESAINTMSKNLEQTGYTVKYNDVKSNILDDYITVEGLSLEKQGEEIKVDNFTFHRDSFGDESSAKPKMVEFSIDNLILPAEYKEKGAFDIYYTYKYNEAQKNLVSKIDIKNKNSADLAVSFNLKNADKAWDCMNKTVKACEISMNAESLNNLLGNISVADLDISFKNNGAIQNKISNLYGEDFKIKELQSFAAETIKKSKIKDINKEALINFINNLDEININMKQKKNNDVKGAVLGFLDKIQKSEFKTEQDFTEYVLDQFDIVVK